MPEVPGSISGQPSGKDKVYKHEAGNKDQYFRMTFMGKMASRRSHDFSEFFKSLNISPHMLEINIKFSERLSWGQNF